MTSALAGSWPDRAVVASPPVSFTPVDAAAEARLDAQILIDIAPYYGELERGFAATHIPRIGTVLPSIGFSTLAKIAWAITIDDRVVGKVVCTVKRGGSWKVGPIVVLPEHRNRGLAAACVVSIVERARAGGWSCVFATVPRANTTARRAFERAGFGLVGALADHYRLGCVEEVMACSTLAPTHHAPVACEPSRVSGGPLERIHRYVIDRFFAIDVAWRRWLMQCGEASLAHFAAKPHDVVHDDALGTALVIYKRGGTAKIVPVVDDSAAISMALLRACERAARRRERQKVAVFLPCGIPGPTGYDREVVASNYSLRGSIAVWSRRIT